MSARIAAGPVWHPVLPAGETADEPEVALLMAPPSRKVLREAWTAMLAEIGAGEEDSPTLSEAEFADGFDAFGLVLIRAGVRGWRGFGRPDGGEGEAPFDPEAVGDLIADYRVHRALEQSYVTPVWAAELEKNGSRPSAAGISEGLTPAKPTADKPAGRAARRARTTSTPRGPRKATPSGKPSAAADPS